MPLIRTRLLVGSTVIGLVAALLPAVAAPTFAATAVCAPSDLQTCINSAAPGDTITLEAGTYDGPITIGKDLTLEGAGRNETTISGGDVVVSISGAPTVTLMDLTITGGSSRGIVAYYGVLTLNGVTVSYNTGSGGIYNFLAAVMLHGSDVSHNTGTNGGGIYNNHGTVALWGSSVSDNNATASGGGIYNNNGTVALWGSNISDNTANGVGGGIRIYGSPGSVTLHGSSVSDNTASNGGGIFTYSAGSVTLQGSKVSDNHPNECYPPSLSC